MSIYRILKARPLGYPESVGVYSGRNESCEIVLDSLCKSYNDNELYKDLPYEERYIYSWEYLCEEKNIETIEC